MAELTIRINPENGTLSFDRVMCLGSQYELTFEGVTGSVDVVIANHSGVTLAASSEGVLVLSSDDLAEEFEILQSSFHCRAKVFHIYAYAESAVIADSDVIIKWTPYEFTAAGLPISLKGDKGDKGNDGRSAYEIWLTKPGNAGKTENEFVLLLKGASGDDGENGAYIPMGGMYAFTVDNEGHLIIHAQDGDKLFAVDSVGAPDYTKPLFVLTEAGHIAYQFWDNGAVVQTVDLGLVKGDQGEAFVYADFTIEQLALLKGEPGNDGADGLTEGEVQTVVEAYEYATAAAVALKADAAAIADMATQTAVAAALALKQNALAWDNEPTTGSDNAVSSGVLKTMFAGVNSSIASAVGVNTGFVQDVIKNMVSGLTNLSDNPNMDEISAKLSSLIAILKG